MRNGAVLIQFWMPESECKRLDKRVKKSGLTRSAYLRFLIQNLVPQDLPPLDYHRMMRQLFGISNNLNQLAIKAHEFGMLDTKQYEENVKELNRAVLEIKRAVTLPRKKGNPQNACILWEEDEQRIEANICQQADEAERSL